MYGAVFSYVLTKRRTLDPATVKGITKSAGLFILYNLALGSVNRTTDLSAHLGGLIGGFVAGLMAG